MKPILLFAIALTVFNGIDGQTSLKPLKLNDSTIVHNFLSILPQDKISDIEKSHLENDEGFKAAVLYFQKNDWKNLVKNVVKTKEFIAFGNLTAKYKLNITQSIDCMARHVESLKVKITPDKAVKPNLESFINDIQKALPIGDIVKYVTNKDNNSIADRIRQEIGSKENQKIAENLHNLSEMKKMREILKDMHFDVEPYIALVYTFLGWIH